jgi:hypothetical protein
MEYLGVLLVVILVMAGGPIAELIYLKFFNKNDRH